MIQDLFGENRSKLVAKIRSNEDIMIKHLKNVLKLQDAQLLLKDQHIKSMEAEIRALNRKIVQLEASLEVREEKLRNLEKACGVGQLARDAE